MDNMQTTINHYNKYTPLYYKVCGSLIESCVSNNPRDVLSFIGAKTKLNTEDAVLDAGCGFGGPATYFATTFRSNILGININKEQLNIANEIKNGANINNLNFKLQDFHNLSDLNTKFTKILFIESIGHCNDLDKVLKESYKVLDNNGIIFIKTMFTTDGLEDVEKKVRDFYGYSIYKKEEFIKSVNKANLDIVEFNQFPNIDLDITLSEKFETGAGVEVSYKNPIPWTAWKYIILKKLKEKNGSSI